MCVEFRAEKKTELAEDFLVVFVLWLYCVLSMDLSWLDPQTVFMAGVCVLSSVEN